MISGGGFAMALWLGIALVVVGQIEPSRPALTVRLVRPDMLDDRVNALFEGARAPHPAAALSGWRRATGKTLDKSAEAAIALFNPDSARELAVLDDLLVSIRFDAATGRVRWSAIVPKDDGSIDAGVTALVLTGGGPDAPLEPGIAVSKLGMTAGPALAARTKAGKLALAGSREDLAFAISKAEEVENPASKPIATGLLVTVDPTGLPTSGPIVGRRIGEAFRAAGCRGMEASATLEGDVASVTVSGRFDHPVDGRRVDPNWLEIVPANEAAAAFALAIDASPEALNAAFAWIDKIERVDPSRIGLAPSRVRLNLVAAAAGVRPEVDVWPAIRGISGFVLGGPAGRFEGGLVALHTRDEASAMRMESEVLPRLARSILKSGPGTASAGRRMLGTVADRPLLTSRMGSTVLVSWGSPALDACLATAGRPERSASSLLRAEASARPPSRFVALWPGRVPSLSPRLAAALADSTPATWRGDRDGATTRDEIRWGGLRAAVRRFLEGMPWKPFEG